MKKRKIVYLHIVTILVAISLDVICCVKMYDLEFFTELWNLFALTSLVDDIVIIALMKSFISAIK